MRGERIKWKKGADLVQGWRTQIGHQWDGCTTVLPWLKTEQQKSCAESSPSRHMLSSTLFPTGAIRHLQEAARQGIRASALPVVYF